MNLQRNHKDYIKVSRSVFKNDLSLEARGFMSNLFYLSDEFKFSVSGISKVFKVSEHKINKIINELCEKGFCIKLLERDKNNRFKELHYFFFSDKVDQIEVEPYGTFSVTEISNWEKSGLYYNINIILQIINTLKEKNIKKENLADAPNSDLRTQLNSLEKTTHLTSKKEEKEERGAARNHNSLINKHLTALEEITSEIRPDIYPILVEWLNYKWEEKKEKYKSGKTILTLYKRILKESGGDISLITQSVEKSISNRYSGIFFNSDSKPKLSDKHFDETSSLYRTAF